MNFDSLKNFMDRLTLQRVPGNSIAIYQNNQEIFKYSSGYSNAEKKEEMKGNELLNIYSCSKVVTVTAALQLYEKGMFLLDDPLYEYIPEYKEMFVKDEKGRIHKAKNYITLRHLFTMTAGFTYNMNSDGIKKAKEATNGRMDTLQTIKCMAQDFLAFEPGTRWNYSLCHDVLAAVVEAITGKRFESYVASHIFEPLGVNRVYYHRDKTVKQAMAEQYLFKNGIDKSIVEAQMRTEGSEGSIVNIGKDVDTYILGENYDSGGAGMVISVPDFALFASALANGGIAPNGEKILSTGTIDLLRINQLTNQQMSYFNWPHLKGYGYGLGVRTLINKSESGSIGNIGEFGWGGAAGATLLVDPSCKLAYFYAHHMLNPYENYYQPRLRNVVYSCIS